MHMESIACSWIKFSFEYVKVLIQCCINGPCCRTYDFKCSNTTQGKVIVAEVIHPGFRDPHLGMEA